MAQFERRLIAFEKIKQELKDDMEQDGRHWENSTDWHIYRSDVSFLVEFVEFLIQENAMFSSLKKEYEE